jgi:hypothetical protein
MTQKSLTLTEMQELWTWLGKRPLPPWADPAPPDWLLETINDPAVLHEYAQNSVSLRLNALQLELEKTKLVKELIGSLPLPLP